jgi:hypothetical protein
MLRLRKAPQQLALFPGRKKSNPSVLEFPKQCVIADACRLFISPGWKWTHLPFGEYRTPSTADRLKRMGVMPGWPDLLFVAPWGLHHYVELKRIGGRLNAAQAEMRRFFHTAGVPYLLSADVGEVLHTLQFWGALRSDARF